jgi:hypothetical protein
MDDSYLVRRRKLSNVIDADECCLVFFVIDRSLDVNVRGVTDNFEYVMLKAIDIKHATLK